MRKAVVEIETGKVLNVVILADSWTGEGEKDWQPPKGTELVNAEKSGAPGDTWDGVEFVHPSTPEQEFE